MNESTISIAIITLNEENNISRCLKSVRWADELVVADSGSKDATAIIAREFGATVYEIEFHDFSQAKQEAINRCSSDWVLVLDADEEISLKLQNKIQSLLRNPGAADGYKIKRIAEFLGKKMHYGEWGSDYPTRLFRRESGKMNGARIHESVIVQGKVERINDPMYHYPYSSMNEYSQKINRYSQLVAEEMVEKGRRVTFFDIFSHSGFKFFQSYILKAGFMDGRRGLLLACYLTHYVMLKYTKAWEMLKINK
jgi:glycosyltransferase involved in cell wall biosynthesis